MVVCIVVGSIVSYFTEPNDPAMVSDFKRFGTSAPVSQKLKYCSCPPTLTLYINLWPTFEFYASKLVEYIAILKWETFQALI